jgi:heat shock protein HslJ
MRNTLILILFATLLMSNKCEDRKNSSKQVEDKKALNFKRVWMLIEFKNYSKEDLVKNEAKLDLTNDNRASAYMGCNNIGYSFSLADNQIIFSQGMATKMYCDKNTLEDDFLKSIDEKMVFKIDGHFLFLTNSKNETLKFVAQDWD